MWKYRIYFIVGGGLLAILLYFVIYHFLSEKHKAFARLFAITILIEIGISPLRSYVSFMACMVAGFVLFALWTFYLLKNYQPKFSKCKLLLIPILVIVAINLQRLFDFRGTLISLPDELFHLLGIFVGYALFEVKNSFKWIILFSTILLCGFMYFIGYDLWINKLNYGTYFGAIENGGKKEILIFSDNANKNIQLTSRNKILILDFWYSRCGVCFSKFPMVQKVYERFKNNPQVELYAINSFFSGFDKDGDAFKIIKEKGYSFPVLVCKDKTLLQALEIEAYPTVIIVNNNDELVFRGSINQVEKKIEELLNENH